MKIDYHQIYNTMLAMKKPEGIFHESKGNSYEITKETDGKSLTKLENAASFVRDFMDVSKYKKLDTHTYLIKGDKYQAAMYRFSIGDDNSCSLEISTPSTFESGKIRMWITGNNGKRLWANVYDLEDVEFSGRSLFVYLGGEDESVTDFSVRMPARFFGDDTEAIDTHENDRNDSSESDEGTFEPDDELPF